MLVQGVNENSVIFFGWGCNVVRFKYTQSAINHKSHEKCIMWYEDGIIAFEIINELSWAIKQNFSVKSIWRFYKGTNLKCNFKITIPEISVMLKIK